MANRQRIRVGYEEPYNDLYYGMDVMLMDFDVEMIPMPVYDMSGTCSSHSQCENRSMQANRCCICDSHAGGSNET